ncbi:MAG: hypothetical protein Q9214_004135 [Letrouitia sp. 1 TL-2023]
MSPLVTATLQAAVLGLCSSAVATFLSSKRPPVLALFIFSILITPPNYLWQQYIEKKLPGYATEKVESDRNFLGSTPGGKGIMIKRKLNVRNTLVKVGLDQTIGALINTSAYLGAVQFLRGVPPGLCWQAVKEDGECSWLLKLLFDCRSLIRVAVARRMSGGITSANSDTVTVFEAIESIQHQISRMAHRPFRNRPNLHLALVQQTGSPRHLNTTASVSSRISTPFGTPTGTPLAAAYSPYRSANLKAPTPYGSFSPRPTSGFRRFVRSCWLMVKRALNRRPIWFMILLGFLMLWWFNGGRHEVDAVKMDAARLRRELLQDSITKDLQFFPASNPKIRPADQAIARPAEQEIKAKPNHDHLSFHLGSSNEKPAAPVSLLARINRETYVLLPNVSSLVSVSSSNLLPATEYHIRIVAPMVDDHGKGIVQLEGLWLSKGGKLLRVEGSLLSEEYADEDALHAQSDQIGERHRLGLSNMIRGSSRNFNPEKILRSPSEAAATSASRKKTLEILTDCPGSFGDRLNGTAIDSAEGLLGGETGWEYLLGEMFGVDHVGVSVDGIGTAESAHFERPWLFDSYVPDVLIINIGSSDHYSFNDNVGQYNRTTWDLNAGFETTYVALIKAIRTLAYPKHPSIVHSERSSGAAAFIPNSVPASIPIFIMRPFRGELEQSTQNVVNRLRADGDKAVFWLDTSGWLDMSETSLSAQQDTDFWLDERSDQAPRWRLTKRGNQRVASFLQLFLCRYLAQQARECPFLPQEVYTGKSFDMRERDFERYVEMEKERKLRELFWGSG